MAAVNIFLDTMIYLHFVPLDQIDFCDALGAAQVIIVVPRVTFRELEKHKSGHAQGGARERARQALVVLDKHLESGAPLRQGVVVRSVPLGPRLDLARYGLEPQWNDDVLIASVLAFTNERPSEDAVLVTEDTGVRQTCRHLGVRTFRLPEKYQLPLPPDEAHQEIARLRRELQKLQNALPKLRIGFGDELESVCRFTLEPAEEVDAQGLSRALSRIKRELPALARTEPPNLASNDMLSPRIAEMIASANAIGGIPDEEFERYNKDRLSYFVKYEQYLRAATEAKARRKRMLRFTISVANTGFAPAEDVDVSLHFPDGFSLCEEDELPPPPSEPRRPVKPRTKLEMMTANFGLAGLRLPEPYSPSLAPLSAFRVRKTNSYEVSDHFHRIKHGQTETLPELFLTFNSYEEATSFHCTYELNVGNLPDALIGRLHFAIDNGNVAESVQRT